MRTNVIETVMGAVVLLIAAFFLIFAYKNSGYGTQGESNPYQAIFDRVDGLVVGSDVRMSGVKIGAVQRIAIDPKTFLAHVWITLQSAIKLPKDSSAEIVSDGLMGGKYMSLTPGGEEDILQSGGMIEHTQSSVSLEQMIGQLIYSSSNKPKETPEAALPKHQNSALPSGPKHP